MSDQRPRRKPAIVVTAMVEVLCPHCGEPQPNPDNGGHTWMPSELLAISESTKDADCVGCDEPLRVLYRGIR